MLLTHRLGRLAVRAGSGCALLAVVAGVPAALVVFIGWPLPRHLPAGWDEVAAILTGRFPDTAVVGLLTTAVWLVWAAFLRALAVEVAAARRGRPARRIRLISPMQALAALLVAGLAASPVAASVAVTAPTPAIPAAAPAGPRTGQADPLPAAWPPHLHHTAATNARPHPPATAGAASAAAPAEPDGTDLPRFALAARTGPLTLTAAGTRYTVIVQRGDTLWDLAEAWLGDPHRWPQIYHLNADRYDQHGRMRGGDHIEPTWHLVLPDDATPPAGATPHTVIPPSTTTPATSPPAATAPTTSPPAPQTPPQACRQPAAAQATTTPTVAPDDDGVVGAAPRHPDRSSLATPSPPAARTATAPADAEPDATSSPSHRSSPPGVSLTGDSWVDLGLALAIAAAAALVWRLRRRRFTPRPPAADPHLDDPDLAPMPQVVTRVRRGLRAPARRPEASLDDLLDDPDATVADPDDDGGLDDVDTGGEPPHGAEQEQAAPPPLNLPALGNPMLAAWPPAGLGLTGPGAEAAARGFLASALAAGGVDDPHGRASVVMPAATLATLLGAAAVTMPDTPRLTVTGDLAEALELLEEQTLHRTRLVYGHEVDTVAQVRDADPTEEPLPPVLLLADAAVPHERARIAALLAQGQRLDIHGVLLGAWPDGNTVVVAADGTTTPADGDGARHGHHPADVGRLAVITAAEAAALLATLAESHTGQPQPPPPTEPRRTRSTAAPAPAATATQTGSHTDADSDALAVGHPTAATTNDTAGYAAARPPHEAHEGAVADAGSAPTVGDESYLDDDRADDADPDAADGPGVVAVRVLGRPAIIGADPDEPLRAKALELLVYLITRDGGATIDAIKEDLVPDATISKAPRRIHTYIYALRKALRRTGGRATYITHPPHRYLLNRDTVDADLWRMRDALAHAETATGPARTTALRAAVDAYTGPLADGARYEWAEPYREAVRRQALNAHLALADALTDQPEQALAVLDAAIRHDPYAEELYRAAMRRHADLGDPDAVAARLAELTRKLEEIDAEPADDTTDLAATLTDDLRRRARPTGGAAA